MPEADWVAREVAQRAGAVVEELPRVLRFRPADTHAITVNYLGGPLSTADGYAMPGLGVLEGLCPTVVVNAEYDDLRPSAEAFAAALAVAGVDVRQVVAPGALHGFLNHSGEIEPVARGLELISGVVAGR